MPTLRVTVEWLDGLYHGVEWPPAPLRLFQAMIAGYSVHRRGDPDLEAAMRHLEALPAPTIFAPDANERAPVRASVPNNDGDNVIGFLLKGKRAKALKTARKTVTTRVRRPRSFLGTVAYEWVAGAETRKCLPALEAIAESVSAVGHGIDTAVARVEFGECRRPDDRVRYAPSPLGRRKLDVPYPGAFGVLEARYREFRNRIEDGGVKGVREPVHRQSGYASDLDPPPVRCATFRLQDTKGRLFAFEGVRAMEVAAMTRHVVGRAAASAGMATDAVSELMGHGGGRRVRVHPLPNVGHFRADGLVRRVMLTAPESVGEDDWGDILSRMAWAELVPVGGGEPVGSLVPITEDDDDPVRARYCGVSKVWTTATPVVLPGRDRRRGKPRPERAVRRLLQHAQIPEALLEAATMEPAGCLRGSEMPSRYARPRHLAGYPCQHMSVRWKTPVAGPLVLGAGIGYGLGLFMPRHFERQA